MVALSAGFLYLFLLCWTRASIALLVVAGYGLGTAAWSTVSQAMWQHGPGMLSLSIALFAIRDWERGGSSNKGAILAGTAMAVAMWCRNLNIVPAFAIGLYLLSHHRSRVMAYCIPLLLAGAALVAFNWWTYGDISGGYSAIYESPWHRDRGIDQSNVFTNPFFHGLASILFSPNKGLFIYSPWLLFGLAAIWNWKTPRAPKFTLFLAIWVGLMFCILSKNLLWWGGTAFGPRYFSETSIALAILAALGLNHASSATIKVCSGLIVLSIGLHLFGAFYAPCGWADEPRLADLHPERYWDWQDPEILRCAKKGIIDGPPMAFEFISDP